MEKSNPEFLERVRQYQFQLKHLIVLVLVLIFFLFLVSLVHKTSLQKLLVSTQDWYQRDSAERMANLLTNSLELLIETSGSYSQTNPEASQRIIQAINNILSQSLLQQNVEDICLLVSRGDSIFAIDNAHVLYDYFFGQQNVSAPTNDHQTAIQFYREIRNEMRQTEQIYSLREGASTFHVFVPFVPKGEFLGALYVKNTPNFSFITREVISSYDETALIFAALILLGLLAMFYISSYTVKERDLAQKQLYEEREKHLLEQIHHQKESQFTQRIYHAHHKAEKIMGFIKEDLARLDRDNIEAIKYRITRYANFISRVIYDMKWYDPPLQTIRNPMFRTQVNEVVRFLVENIFKRVSKDTGLFQFKLDLDEDLPPVHINEFVVWEIIEPLIQNSLDHAGDGGVTITIRSRFDKNQKKGYLEIMDNGKGIHPDLLKPDEEGVKMIFREHTTTKQGSRNSGYGCYLAYEIARQRCGWQLDAENLPDKGCRFVITIPFAEGA